MSADPKSLAILAITPTNKGKARQSFSDDSSSTEDEYGTDEFVAGSTAAFINTTALFPVNKLIFRQMVGGHGTKIAAVQMKSDGFRYLYRGILPPLIQKMATVSIMFGSFSHYKKWIDRKFSDNSPIVNLVIAGLLTGSTEAVLTPLERVQMLLQDRRYHTSYKNTIDALIKLRQFGMAEYYRGLTCVLIRNGPSNILFFGLREELSKLMSNFTSDDNVVRDVGNGLENTETISDNLMSSRGRQEDNNSNRATTKDYLMQGQQLAHGPVTTLQSGHNHLKGQNDSMLHAFLSGGVLGMFISTLFYPLSVVRTRMQTRAPGTEFLSIMKAFNAVYSERDRKFTRLFHGCLINVMRQFLSWGIINCSYEFVLDQLHNMR